MNGAVGINAPVWLCIEARGYTTAAIEDGIVRHKPPKPSRRLSPPDGQIFLSKAAQATGAKFSVLSMACSRGQIPCIRQGRNVFVRLDDVWTYIGGKRARKAAASRQNIAKAHAVRRGAA